MKDNSSKSIDLKKVEKSLSLIPKGTLEYGSDIDHRNVPTHGPPNKKISIDSFYISKFEVSNGEYLNFVNDLKEKDPTMYSKMLPDTLVWHTMASFGEPYLYHYFRHPAYRNYPVVGISYEQAEKYCKWLTNEYLKEEKRKFKQVEFKLPNMDQWTYAAKGGLHHFSFPWGGPSMRNKKGQWLANFRVIPQDNIRKDTMKVSNNIRNILIAEGRERLPSRKDSYDDFETLAPVTSFYPNDYGLYNMSGNAEEYVKEKGITKGGSWLDTGYYLQTDVAENYDSTNYVSCERGFRFIMTLVK
jgi:formylglycine-generating enzyme required for sulfatase activity